LILAGVIATGFGVFALAKYTEWRDRQYRSPWKLLGQLQRHGYQVSQAGVSKASIALATKLQWRRNTHPEDLTPPFSYVVLQIPEGVYTAHGLSGRRDKHDSAEVQMRRGGPSLLSEREARRGPDESLRTTTLRWIQNVLTRTRHYAQDGYITHLEDTVDDLQRSLADAEARARNPDTLHALICRLNPPPPVAQPNYAEYTAQRVRLRNALRRWRAAVSEAPVLVPQDD
jgi:hypothetical protein